MGEEEQWKEINKLKDSVAEVNTNVEVMAVGITEQKKVMDEMLNLSKATHKEITGNGNGITLLSFSCSLLGLLTYFPHLNS